MTVIGKENISFNPNEIETHPIRSAASMAMYPEKVPEYTIMLIGRCSSKAFLCSTIKNDEKCSHNISTHVIKNQYFTRIPNFQPHTSTRDPLLRNHCNNYATRCNIGGLTPLMETPRSMVLWT